MATQTYAATATQPQAEINYLNHARGLKSWLLTLDHKRIGLLYLISIALFFVVGGILALLVRLELFAPGQTIMSAETYNHVFTLHGAIMIFLFLIPAAPAVLGNFALPIMIGARDVAFPRLNLASWYIFWLGAIMMLVGIVASGLDTGWTFYTPYSTMTGSGVTWVVLGVFILGFSSILTGLNFIVTIHKMRAPGMTWSRLPLFVWGLYATSIVQILATPVLGITLLLLALERILKVGIFDPALGGDPVLFQHFFWFYSHPAVYIMVLPVFGMISEILPVHARKPIFAYKAIAYSSLAICFLGLIVWVHHMFTSGTPDWMRVFFMIATMAIAVPTGIKVFSWLATLWGGKIHFRSAMLFGMGFISMFVIGGLSGIILASVPLDIHVHDTYFVVAHLHYVLFGGSVFGIYAGLYHWFPKMTGRLLNEFWGRVHFVLTFVGFNMCFLPMHKLGLMGMPRRVAQYDPQFADLNWISSVGAFVLAISTLPFLVNAIYSWVAGPKAGDNPWQALTLEWATSSPPPAHNFYGDPILLTGPYDYGLHSKETLDYFAAQLQSLRELALAEAEPTTSS